MAVDLKIGQSAYDGLPDALKKEYKKDGDDYVLDLKGYEDPTSIRNARDAANRERDEAKRERDTAVRERDAANRKITDLTKDGVTVEEKVAAKEKEMQAKYDTDTGELNGTITKLKETIIGTKRSSIAEGIANKISSAPKLLAPEIQKQLHIELDNEFNPIVKVLGTDGKPSASSLEDLEKRVLTNKDFASVIKASSGSGGGGAPRDPRNGGGAPRANPPTSQHSGDTPLAKLAPAELVARIKANREQNNGA